MIAETNPSEDQKSAKRLVPGTHWPLAFSVAIIVLACFLRYLPFPYRSFWGDDLDIFVAFQQGQFSSDLKQIFLGSYVEKYRPVFQGFLYILLNTFGSKFELYIYFNLFLHVINSLIMLKIGLTVTKSYVIATSMALAFALSRFAIYQVWTLTGLVEALPAFFFLLAILFSILAAIEKNARLQLLAVVFWGFACFAHERYLLFAPILAGAVCLFKTGSLLARERVFLIACIGGVIAAFVGIKTLVLHENFFVGTSHTSLDLDFERIGAYYLSSSLNMVGINSGPNYMSSEDFGQAPLLIVVLSFGIATVTMLAIAKAAAGVSAFAVNSTRARLYGLLVFVGIAVGVLSASITIHLWFRWLLAPYILVLIGVGYGVSRIRHTHAAYALTALFVLLTLVHAQYYRSKEINLNFVRGLKETDYALRLTEGKSAKYLYIVTDEAAPECTWFFRGSDWGRVHMQPNAPMMRCVAHVDDIPKSAAPYAIVLLAAWRDGVLTDITEQVRSRFSPPLAPDDQSR
ncbi:MAG: hypothetical protein EOP06_04220 [Proteobacteria bacterium]|nr:MAG: hypothetical protein EOP06_04220 [Pseudomonadota bacterium]